MNFDMDENMIEGTVSTIIFSNPENGYSVIRLDTPEGVVTAAGSVPGINTGERVLLTGAWTVHQQYGEQFKIDAYEVRKPSGSDEIFRYLASGAIKNIGPSKAREIVDRFGSEALLVIENEPDKLSAIKGISLKAARKIGDGYRRQAGLRRLIDFLDHYGVKPVVATRIYKDYGDDAVAAVSDNPYIIASDYYGADFAQADAIAIELGFESDSPQRVSAALIFELMHNLSNGHTFIPKDKLCAITEELIGAGYDAIDEALDSLNECGDVVVEHIAGVEGVYLRDMFDAETYVASRISAMVLSGSKDSNNASDNNTQDKYNPDGVSYSSLQLEAISLSGSSGIMVLTGGPGTGKTTTVHGILSKLDDLGHKTVLCAPTGRAAKRMSEACLRSATTVHRLLGVTPGEDGTLIFGHDEEDPLDADVVIVDECSMLDVLLMKSLLQAMRIGSRLIMIGDADQLPPVGPGNVFGDIIRSGVVPTVALTEIFRQAADSGIVSCAHDVNRGITPDLTVKYKDLFFMRRANDEQLAETVASLYSKRLPENMGIDPSQIQVLTPTRKRLAGTVSLNSRLRDAVNPASPSKKERIVGDFVFRVGDKVMQIRNNYDIIWKTPDHRFEGMGVFNGDVGVVIDIDLIEETLTVDFDDKLVTYMFEQLSELEPAFAMTVHKSQGSEYNAVILVLASTAPPLLTRGVLYTAMTRAKNLLVIVGTQEIMNQMVLNDRRLRRYSGLRARLAAIGD